MRVNDVFPPTCAQEFIVLTGSAEYEAYRRACVAVLLGHDVDVPCTWDAANAKRLHEFSTRTALERSVGVDEVRRSFRSDRPERHDTERAKFGTAIDALPALPLADVIRRREGAAKRARSASGRGAGDGASARTPGTEEEHADVSLGLGPHLQPIADKDWARFGPIVAAWGEASGEPKPLCPIVNHDRAVMVAPSGFRLLNDALYAKLQQERPRLSGPKRAALNGTKSACAMGLVPETLHPPHPLPHHVSSSAGTVTLCAGGKIGWHYDITPPEKPPDLATAVANWKPGLRGCCLHEECLNHATLPKDVMWWTMDFNARHVPAD